MLSGRVRVEDRRVGIDFRPFLESTASQHTAFVVDPTPWLACRAVPAIRAARVRATILLILLMELAKFAHFAHGAAAAGTLLSVCCLSNQLA